VRINPPDETPFAFVPNYETLPTEQTTWSTKDNGAVGQKARPDERNEPLMK
jgi:hypothetical protein